MNSVSKSSASTTNNNIRIRHHSNSYQPTLENINSSLAKSNTLVTSSAMSNTAFTSTTPGSQSPMDPESPPSSPMKKSSSTSSLLSMLKKPFQGWSRELLAARDGLDDDYNFPYIPRRGEHLVDERYRRDY